MAEKGEVELLQEDEVDIAVFVSDIEEQNEGEWRGVCRRDKYGFELEENYAQEHVRLAQRFAAREEQRQLEWNELYKEKKNFTNNTALRALIKRTGIPPEYRREVWKLLTNLKEKIKENEGLYQSLLRTNQNKSNSAVEQIERDLRRTFPGHALFDTADGLGKLRRVLTAYCWWNPALGYCQSMNFISAFLLLVFDEEEAFWMLIHIIHNLLPGNYYTKNMVSALVDQRVFSTLIEKKLLKINLHCRELMYPISVVTSQWFLCLFVGVMNADVTFRVWDLMFLEGFKVMFMVALSLLKQNEQELLSGTDEAVLLTLLREIPRKAFDADALLNTAYTKFASVTNKNIARLRVIHLPAVEQELQQNEVKRQLAALKRTKLPEFLEEAPAPPPPTERMEIQIPIKKAPPSSPRSPNSPGMWSGMNVHHSPRQSTKILIGTLRDSPTSSPVIKRAKSLNIRNNRISVQLPTTDDTTFAQITQLGPAPELPEVASLSPLTSPRGGDDDDSF